MEFQRTFSAAPWEGKIGYCRALRHGDRIFVTGTAAVDDEGRVMGRNDGYAQARRCLELVEQALEDLGGSLDSVVRTRMFVTDISRWKDFGRAHGEVFAGRPPATSMVEVSRLIHTDMLIEIEADAIAEQPPGA